jgi:hypothetical protein
MERTLLKRGGLAIGVLAMAAVPVLGSIDAGAGTSSQAAPSADTVQSHPLGFQAEREAQAKFLNTAAWNEAVAQARAAQGGVRGTGGGGRCAPGDFECFRACTIERESHGNYTDASANGTYRGAWQFSQSTWDSNAAASGRDDLVGQDPAAASPDDQDSVAHATYQARGSQPWGGRC